MKAAPAAFFAVAFDQKALGKPACVSAALAVGRFCTSKGTTKCWREIGLYQIS